MPPAAKGSAVDAYTTGKHVDGPAAKLAYAQQHGKLTGARIEEALRGVGAAARDVSTAQGDDDKDKELDAVFHKLARGYFDILGTPKSLYAAEFRSVVATVGAPVERERNLILLTGRGAFTSDAFPTSGMGAKPLSAEIKELELAIRGESLPHLRAVLSNRTEAEMRTLEREYKLQVGRDLGFDLGVALMFKGGAWRVEADEIAAMWHGDVFKPSPDKDERGNLFEEGLFLHGRIVQLHQQAKSRRGVYARARDWYGNEENDLLEASKEAADDAYKGLVDAANKKTDLSDLRRRVNALRHAHVRLKRSIAIKDEATQRSFADFVDTAVGLVTLAASLVGGPSGMLLRVIVAKVGTKVVLLGPDYTAKAFIEDVASEATGVIGGQVAFGVLAKGVPGIAAAARRTKLPLNPEIAALAGKGTRWAVDVIGSSIGSRVPGAVLGDKGFRFPSVEEFITALGMTGAHRAN